MTTLYCINCNDFTKHMEGDLCSKCAYKYKEGDESSFDFHGFPAESDTRKESVTTKLVENNDDSLDWLDELIEEKSRFPYPNNYDYQEEDEPVWLTEEDELIAAYGRHNLEFVRDQHWVDDSLEHYLGEYKPNKPTKEQVEKIQQMRDTDQPSYKIIKAIEAVDSNFQAGIDTIYSWLKKNK